MSDYDTEDHDLVYCPQCGHMVDDMSDEGVCEDCQEENDLELDTEG